MRVIIAGSRNLTFYTNVIDAVRESGLDVTEVVCGMARGVDLLGRRWARERGIPVKEFPADWARLGRGAGHARNWEMARYADALIAVWDGRSGGTKHMIETARRQGLKVFVKEVRL